ncbi:MAG: amidohydrolase family protein [Gammaproteobacteria bacterium]|nr:amidohydrolase family protein [Gammaproteobacteria bacterium]
MMTITDAQVHIWSADSPSRPWPEYGHSYAHGDELLGEQMLARMSDAGVDRAVLVPPSWEGDRNDVCLAAAQAHPKQFAVMGRLPIELDESRDLAEEWLNQPGMIGVRLTFHRNFQRQWLRDGTADWFWAAAERVGIPVMVFVPGSIPEIGAIAEKHPDLRLVIDHLGLFGTLDEELPKRLKPTLELARYPNVAVKASCMPNLVTEPYPFVTLQSAIEEVVAAFGPQRTFWGSDVSRLTCPLRECVTLFTEQCKTLTDDDKRWIMGHGIAEWLNWKE